jgi:predicted dehydrogenase
MAPLRIGVLGAARITPMALIRPAQSVPEARVTAVAARDRKRASRFAAKHHIETVHDTYEALIADPNVDAIYNPLPNGLHTQWNLAALAVGKHVLCEKPLSANAAEAGEVAAAAQRSGKVVMEAFHYRYHPLAERMKAIVASGELGKVRRVETWMCFPLPFFSNIRYRYDLAGGSLMDQGCYAIHLARLLGGGEPEVVSAKAKLHGPDVDRAMVAELRFPGGHTARVESSMWSTTVVRMAARVEGEAGELRVFNPYLPQMWHRFAVRVNGRKRLEHFPGPGTYEHQLRRFCAVINEGATNLTPPSDSIANMRVIDGIYRAAGLKLRGVS